MAISSGIEWTEATWNPITGCTRVSRGCDNCYAATLSKRLAAMGQEKYEGLINEGKAHFNGVVKLHPDTLSIPQRRTKSTVYFVNSMSDLYHREVPVDFIVDVFEVMARCPQHVFQVLTKRPERMAAVMPEIYREVAERLGRSNGRAASPLTNAWLGTSVEDQEAADIRIPHLQATEAAVRFLSCEPLLAPVNHLDLADIDWVIIGGESGPKARKMELRWAEDIIERCREANVAVFVKQLGAAWARTHGSEAKGKVMAEWPEHLRIRKMPVDGVPV